MKQTKKIYFCERVPDPDKKADGISQHRLAYRLLEQSIRENWPETEKEPFHYTAAPGGKPRLEGHPEIHFNISHCAACAACAATHLPHLARSGNGCCATSDCTGCPSPLSRTARSTSGCPLARYRTTPRTDCPT